MHSNHLLKFNTLLGGKFNRNTGKFPQSKIVITLYENITANITLNDGKAEHFPLRPSTMQGYSLFKALQHSMEVLEEKGKSKEKEMAVEEGVLEKQ